MSWLKLALDYKESLKSAQEQVSKSINLEMALQRKFVVRELEEILSWVVTGRDPESRTDIGKRGAYLHSNLVFYISRMAGENAHHPSEAEIITQLDESFKLLSPREKQVFQLVHVEGLSWLKAGERLGIKKTTIQNRLNNAEKKIKEYWRGCDSLPNLHGKNQNVCGESDQ